MTHLLQRMLSIFNRSSSDHRSLRDKFSDIYANNGFFGRFSRSGEGSDLVQTEVIGREIPKLVAEFGIKTFVDAPCGDLFWIKQVELGVAKYIGIDIVDALIEKNKKEFATSSREFYRLNIVEDALPPGDIILCRDCLVHLNYEDIFGALRNFKRAGYRYLLTTTFTDRSKNIDLVGKKIWRPLNLQIEPFRFPEPLKLINEKCSEENGAFADKSLALWPIDQLQVGV